MDMESMSVQPLEQARRGGARLHVPMEGRARRLVGVHRDPFVVGVSDISRTGMRLECLPDAGAAITPGDRLHVVIPVDEPGEPVAVTGTVMWDGFVRGRNPWVIDATGSEDARWRFGLRFDHEEPDLAHRLPRPERT